MAQSVLVIDAPRPLVVLDVRLPRALVFRAIWASWLAWFIGVSTGGIIEAHVILVDDHEWLTL
jgi:hypothetical protein